MPPLRTSSFSTMAAMTSRSTGSLTQSDSVSSYRKVPSRLSKSTDSGPASLGSSGVDGYPQELRPIASSFLQITSKRYISGRLSKLNDLTPEGRPFAVREWTAWYVELVGPVLKFWAIPSSLNGKQPAHLTPAKIKAQTVPNFINITDSEVNLTPTLTLSSTSASLKNVISLNSAGANRFYLQAESTELANQWVLAIRLACFEIAKLHEVYTAALLKRPGLKSVAGGGDWWSQGGSSYTGYMQVRVAGSTEWKRVWVSVSTKRSFAGSIGARSSVLIGRSRSSSNDLNSSGGRGQILLYDSKKSKKALSTIMNVYQGYAVYPESPTLMEVSSICKIEGTIVDHASSNKSDISSESSKHTESSSTTKGEKTSYLLFMAGSPEEMAKFLLCTYANFKLYSVASASGEGHQEMKVNEPLHQDTEGPEVYLKMEEVFQRMEAIDSIVPGGGGGMGTMGKVDCRMRLQELLDQKLSRRDSDSSTSFSGRLDDSQLSGFSQSQLSALSQSPEMGRHPRASPLSPPLSISPTAGSSNHNARPNGHGKAARTPSPASPRSPLRAERNRPVSHLKPQNASSSSRPQSTARPISRQVVVSSSDDDDESDQDEESEDELSTHDALATINRSHSSQDGTFSPSQPNAPAQSQGPPTIHVDVGTIERADVSLSKTPSSASKNGYIDSRTPSSAAVIPNSKPFLTLGSESPNSARSPPSGNSPQPGTAKNLGLGNATSPTSIVSPPKSPAADNSASIVEGADVAQSISVGDISQMSSEGQRTMEQAEGSSSKAQQRPQGEEDSEDDIETDDDDDSDDDNGSEGATDPDTDEDDQPILSTLANANRSGTPGGSGSNGGSPGVAYPPHMMPNGRTSPSNYGASPNSLGIRQPQYGIGTANTGIGNRSSFAPGEGQAYISHEISKSLEAQQAAAQPQEVQFTGLLARPRLTMKQKHIQQQAFHAQQRDEARRQKAEQQVMMAQQHRQTMMSSISQRAPNQGPMSRGSTVYGGDSPQAVGSMHLRPGSRTQSPFLQDGYDVSPGHPNRSPPGAARSEFGGYGMSPQRPRGPLIALPKEEKIKPPMTGLVAVVNQREVDRERNKLARQGYSKSGVAEFVQKGPGSRGLDFEKDANWMMEKERRKMAKEGQEEAMRQEELMRTQQGIHAQQLQVQQAQHQARMSMFSMMGGNPMMAQPGPNQSIMPQPGPNQSMMPPHSQAMMDNRLSMMPAIYGPAGHHTSMLGPSGAGDPSFAYGGAGMLGPSQFSPFNPGNVPLPQAEEDSTSSSEEESTSEESESPPETHHKSRKSKKSNKPTTRKGRKGAQQSSESEPEEKENRRKPSQRRAKDTESESEESSESSDDHQSRRRAQRKRTGSARANTTVQSMGYFPGTMYSQQGFMQPTGHFGQFSPGFSYGPPPDMSYAYFPQGGGHPAHMSMYGMPPNQYGYGAMQGQSEGSVQGQRKKRGSKSKVLEEADIMKDHKKRESKGNRTRI